MRPEQCVNLPCYLKMAFLVMRFARNLDVWQRTTHELRPGGADIEVTNENKMAYIHLVADWRLNG